MFAPLPGPVEPGAAGGRGNAQTPADFLVGQALLVGHFQQLAVPFRQLSGKNLVQGAAGGGERGRQPNPGRPARPRIWPGPPGEKRRAPACTEGFSKATRQGWGGA